MKTKSSLITLAVAATAAVLFAGKEAGGPNGGRLLATEPLRSEFRVTAERRLEITFLDAALKPAAPGAQEIAVTAEPAGGRTRIELERTATGFVSRAALPAGEPYRVVVQARAAPGARPANFRIDLNLATCGECRRQEYACTCEGH